MTMLQKLLFWRHIFSMLEWLKIVQRNTWVPCLPGMPDHQTCVYTGCGDKPTVRALLLPFQDIGGVEAVTAWTCEGHAIEAATRKLVDRIRNAQKDNKLSVASRA